MWPRGNATDDAAHATQPSLRERTAAIVNCISPGLRQSFANDGHGGPALQSWGTGFADSWGLGLLSKSHEEMKYARRANYNVGTNWPRSSMSGMRSRAECRFVLGTGWRFGGSTMAASCAADGDRASERSSDRQLYVLAVFAESETTTKARKAEARWYCALVSRSDPHLKATCCGGSEAAKFARITCRSSADRKIPRQSQARSPSH